MKKIHKITIIIISICLLLVGTAFSVIGSVGGGQSRNSVKVVYANNTYLDGTDMTIDQCTPNECLFILANNVKNFNSYQTTVSGKVNASGYKQTISGEKYIMSDCSLYVSRSTSLLKNMAKQMFISGDCALVRNGNPKTNVYSDSVTKYTLGAYLDDYGTDYRELSNYVLNDKTISKSTLASVSDGLYTFKYEINVKKGVDLYRVNMYKMGSLNSLPTITKSILEVVMTSDFMPVSIKQTDEYTVSMFATLSCKSTLVERYEKINDETIQIPDYSFFTSKI